ncbi:type II toxin-antitoxin system RelE/ParE family toxin [Candidatus Shapirobacteria bacterium CG08_land_8_20_14_0_20_39_18]|uniref:Type II toxin-antitoxin system RelE/ParE family toxin n=1 Tax=Candidatus Shapirobacteria bacterium CG08_land_8_20_14_0_20_39_18 TaxID=1974883 RepID=A0A2M6XCT5_9BACT|nr:MAG: type II toxin-antitoxin system RelE/ParE family toxin [Candidatus Shapirobacteria bacterium CG08_land_8_20_14_0_20_39_18]PIY65079.1 MAG: type II toxin-antitoxin system RelE/ParE family toxin [Candidatus Shapirobacteria bacterium CG_4_10_14_0_8_um_filter_39_15]
MGKWNILYFQSARGEKFVKEFIDVQNSMIQGKYAGMVDFLSEYGPFLIEKYTKKIQSNLYELRITGKEQIRVLYTVVDKDIILLHAFKKKTQKVPRQEIELADSRRKLLNTS